MTARDKEEGNKAMHITLGIRLCGADCVQPGPGRRAHRRPDVGGPHWGFLRFTLKIMRKLVSAGIVCSFKGAHGGYILARPAGEITLRQVIEAVEGPYRFSRCLDSEYDCNCPSTEPCPFHSVFGRGFPSGEGQTGSGDFCPECLIQREQERFFASYIE